VPSSSSSAGQPQRPRQGLARGCGRHRDDDGSDLVQNRFSRRRRANHAQEARDGLVVGRIRARPGRCGLLRGSSSDNNTSSSAASRPPTPSRRARRQLLDHAQRPAAAGRTWRRPSSRSRTRPASRSTSRSVGWDVQLDRIKNAAVSGQGPDVTQAGTTQVPFFAALGGFENLTTASPRSAARTAYAPACGRRPSSRAPTAPSPCRGSPRRGRSTTARTS
jgi:hypothetical protein